jgi:hypothetical protein
MKRVGSIAAMVCLAVAALATGCSDSNKGAQLDDAGVRRRVFGSPPGRVRAVPPHDINSEGVGPYRLGARMREVLNTIPHGPRVEISRIEGLFDYSLVRTEDDTLVVGVRRSTGVAFISVLAEKIGLTEDGVGVGSTSHELTESLGEPLVDDSSARDPRIRTFSSLPQARFLVEGGRVRAVVVAPSTRRVAAKVEVDAGVETGCGYGLRDHDEDVVSAAKLRSGARTEVVHGCFASMAGDALVISAPRIVLVVGQPGKLRRVAAAPITGLVFGGAVDIDGDKRHEIAAVSLTSTATEKVVKVTVLRAEGGRLAPLASETVFKLSSSWAAWVGAKLEDTELFIEVEGRGGIVAVGGLYVHRDGNVLRDVLPLSSKPLVVRQKRRPGGAAPSGRPPDAGLRAPPLPPPPDAARKR